MHAARKPLESSKNEIIVLRGRLDDIEDRSQWQSNFKDTPRKTWSETEGKLIDALSKIPGRQYTGACIEHAHSLGWFITGKFRPVIVIFSSCNTKESVVLSHQNFQAIGLIVYGDFSLAKGQATGKLIECGKSLGALFKLCHSKLFVGGKCRLYNTLNNAVCLTNYSVAAGTGNDKIHAWPTQPIA